MGDQGLPRAPHGPPGAGVGRTAERWDAHALGRTCEAACPRGRRCDMARVWGWGARGGRGHQAESRPGSLWASPGSWLLLHEGKACSQA